MASFGEWLRDMRDMRGMTLESFADKVGMTHPTISRYEHNRQNPKRSTIIKLAAALGVDADSGLLAAGYVPINDVTREGDRLIALGKTYKIEVPGGKVEEVEIDENILEYLRFRNTIKKQGK